MLDATNTSLFNKIGQSQVKGATDLLKDQYLNADQLSTSAKTQI